MDLVAQRRTRAALAEIPAQLDRLRVGGSPLQRVVTNTNTSPQVPPSFLSPSQSPDEHAIIQRGRRRLPVTWSPDIELRNRSFHSVIRTPPKETTIGVTPRSTPRKRLLLEEGPLPLTPEKLDFSDISTPEKFRISESIRSPVPIKRLKIDKQLNAEFKGPLELALKGLSSAQLITMIKDMVKKHPELEEEIRKDLPVPDLRPLEEKLRYLKCNIYKSLPTSRLLSKSDSPAYSRVATHITAFKKCLIEQGKMLVESQHWEAVVEYMLLAWSYVRDLPVWDHQAHNLQRKLCFRALANYCTSALKEGQLEVGTLKQLEGRLPAMAADSDDLRNVKILVQQQLNA